MSVLYILLLNGLTVMNARNCRKLMMSPDVKNATAKNKWTTLDRLNCLRGPSRMLVLLVDIVSVVYVRLLIMPEINKLGSVRRVAWELIT